MHEKHTPAIIQRLQVRYTAARVFITGVSFGLEESILELAAPGVPDFAPGVPFHVRTVTLPKLSQPARWIRVCGIWVLCATTIKDALEKVFKVEALELGEEPRSAGIVNAAPLKEIYKPGLAVTLHGDEAELPASWRPTATCGCGDSVCEHGHCATCDPQGLACGDCAPRRGDR